MFILHKFFWNLNGTKFSWYIFLYLFSSKRKVCIRLLKERRQRWRQIASTIYQYINATFQSVTQILMLSVFFFRRHKRKVQNFLPCKTSPQNNCDAPNATGVIYEDRSDGLPRPTPTHHRQLHAPRGRGIAPPMEVRNKISAYLICFGWNYSLASFFF